MTPWQRYFILGRRAGCPKDQMSNFERADCILQSRQLAASAAARLCDAPGGPTAVGYGGARGGGKSHWLLAQMGVDDCQRVPGLKCLLLRKVGKANMEHFEDLRRRLFMHLKHEFSAYRGILTFANGSRIIAGHYQAEKDIERYLGLGYDVIGIEEATTLSTRKHQDITTCSRTDIPNWRPRIYSTTNPGGIGHAWYKAKFVVPYREKREKDTRFVPARVTDNWFNKQVLEAMTGWQKAAWLDGNWDLAAGQFFTSFRHEVHVVPDFDDRRAREWFAAMDYGFAHYTVVLLGCTDCDGNIFVVDEHAERMWLPQQHAAAIKAMLTRHGIRDVDIGRSYSPPPPWTGGPSLILSPDQCGKQVRLTRFVAGTDVFSRQSDGTTIDEQYAREGITLRPANMDRVNGWAEVMHRLGAPQPSGGLASGEKSGVPPRLFIHQRCARLIECLPSLQHDPNRPEDVLKVDADEDGNGGDDTADCLRYLVATKSNTITQRKLRGL